MISSLSHKRAATPSPEPGEQRQREPSPSRKREKKSIDNSEDHYDSKTIRFTIQNFEDHTEAEGEPIVSPPVFRAHGYDWSIVVYPRGGGGDSVEDNGEVGDDKNEDCILLYLGIRRLNRAVRVPTTFTIRCPNDNNNNNTKQQPQKPIRCVFDETNSLFGTKVSRKRVLEDFLEADGSLAIECCISIEEEHRGVWYPEDLPTDSVLLDLYRDASSTGDVEFVVGSGTGNTKSYKAHKGVLSLRCKRLYEIATHDDSATRIPIPSLKADVFKSLLEFVYTVKTPCLRTKEDATILLEAADLFDYRPLKDHVEAVLLNRFLTAENAASLLVVAEAHNCGLLRERTTKFFVANAAAVTKTRDWARVEESPELLRELLEASIEHSRDDCGMLSRLLGVATSSTPRTEATSTATTLEAGQESDSRDAKAHNGAPVLVTRWKTVYRIE